MGIHELFDREAVIDRDGNSLAASGFTTAGRFFTPAGLAAAIADLEDSRAAAHAAGDTDSVEQYSTAIAALYAAGDERCGRDALEERLASVRRVIAADRCRL